MPAWGGTSPRVAFRGLGLADDISRRLRFIKRCQFSLSSVEYLPPVRGCLQKLERDWHDRVLGC